MSICLFVVVKVYTYVLDDELYSPINSPTIVIRDAVS